METDSELMVPLFLKLELVHLLNHARGVIVLILMLVCEFINLFVILRHHIPTAAFSLSAHIEDIKVFQCFIQFHPVSVHLIIQVKVLDCFLRELIQIIGLSKQVTFSIRERTDFKHHFHFLVLILDL